ncbi:MAG: hypothetical protein M3R38_04420 [Actinomycetota bacterium]|nr:hypothetical protein [Actinomycetota bacterium]MDP9484321.1 hypothetical protein [Actinomycetota bacterium]
MVETPQRGRRYEGAVSRLNMNVDTELLHRIKHLALEERITVTRWVERALREAGSGTPEAVDARRGGGGETSRLSMNIDPDLHRAVKRASLRAGLWVRRYVERVLDEAARQARTREDEDAG